MTDRAIVYDGALPQTSDILNTNLFAMVAAAYQNLAILGSSTVVSGLGCTPTDPATLQVQVGVGTIFTMDETDATAYGDLGTNTANIMKMGINPSVQTLTITPPTTSGDSQVYLVQAILQDIDAGASVLSYYNSSNPAQPFAGPANSGTSQFTIRKCQCTIALKAGGAAPTNSETTPSPDAGYTGLFAITVANGQSSVTSANIVQLATAPFFPTLPAVPGDVQNQAWVYAGNDSGAANAYVITFGAGQPQPSAYVKGMKVSFTAQNTNTATSTVNVNGLGAVTIHRASGVALSAGDINSGQIVELTYDGTFFQMANYLGTGANTNTSTLVDLPYVADSGTANALIATFSPAITSGEQVAGLAILVKLANDITGPATINVNGLGAKTIDLGDLSALSSGDGFVAGEVLFLVYDGTEYQVISGGLPGPAGPAGAAGATGPQGPAGTSILTPGAVGSINFAYITPQSGTNPGGAPQPFSMPNAAVIIHDYFGNQISSGTWQQLSVFNPTDIGGTFPFSGRYTFVGLVQRTA